MSIIFKITGAGLLFLFTIGTGIWLSNSGKPYNTLIFNIHKLIALGTVIFTAERSAHHISSPGAKLRQGEYLQGSDSDMSQIRNVV